MLQITSSRRSLMCSRKSVGPRMEPSGTQALTYILMKTSHSEALKVVYYRDKTN